MHNFGHIDIGDLEKRIQTKIADISEAICLSCLNKPPQEVFNEEAWQTMVEFRETWKQGETLELEQRIKYLKRLLSQGEPLPCEQVKLPKNCMKTFIDCPVCDEGAEVAFDYDLEVDYREGIIIGAEPYINLLKCQCGFTM